MSSSASLQAALFELCLLTPSFRGATQSRTRKLEMSARGCDTRSDNLWIPGSMLTHRPGMTKARIGRESV